MPRSPSSQPPNSALPWIGFSLLAMGMIWVISTLYRTSQNEVDAQGHQTLQFEQEKFLRYATEYLNSARQAAIAELIGFHDEGLAFTLRRWDENNRTINGTFVWPTDSTPPVNAIAPLWSDDFAPVSSPFETITFDLVDHPEITGIAGGFQTENLDVVRYAGHSVAPIAGWAAPRDAPGSPWIIWYRIGPAEHVRGAFIDTGILLADLEAALPSTNLVRCRISPFDATNETQIRLEGLPSYGITFTPGDVFLAKQQSNRLTGTTAALLLLLLFVGIFTLVRSSQRHARDARQKTTFVSLVSHELRTPLTSIRMFADMLATPELPSDQRRKFTATIQNESARLGQLIEQLLSFSLLEKNASRAHLTPVDLNALLQDTLALIAPQLTAAGLIAQPLWPTEKIIVQSDPGTIQQTLTNLLENAAKYAKNTGDIHLTLETARPHAIIRVSDQGPGIPPHRAAEIFEPFVQGHNQLHDKPAGLGLGLAISRAALRNIKADLVLVSTPPGATFEIRLPLTAPTATTS